jgi:hypothetical protein
MVDTRQQRAIRRTVRRVNNEWYRAGMPRQARRRKAEELRTHLWEALGDGRSIDDVVGDDPVVFASEWAAAVRPHPALDLSLQLLAAVTLIPGVIALANPWFHEVFGSADDGVGIPVGLFGAFVLMITFFVGVQVLRRWRHRLTSQQATALFVAGVIVHAVAVATWATLGRDGGRFLVVEPAAAWTLVVLGVAAQALASWLQRRRWR